MYIAFVALGALLRLLPHVPNVAPVAALALFCAAHGRRRFAIGVPLAVLATSDLLIGGHQTWPFVYGAFVLIALLGLALFKRGVTTPRLIGASLASSGLFFLVSNFGVWASGGLYPRTAQGLLTCYAMALPFLRNTITGDFLYVGLLFGGYALATRLISLASAAERLPSTSPSFSRS